MDRVRGKVAIVTGGASGIGRACAMLLAREGASVVITDVDDGAGERAARETQAYGDAMFVRHDVAREADWRAALDATIARHGRLDVLVNNAGIGTPGSIEATTLQAWQAMMSVNSDGVFLGCKHAIEVMKRSGGGSIVNLSSILGIIGDGGAIAYSASKGAVRLLTKSAALYCAHRGYGIRVNSVHPGFIWTPMVEGLVNNARDPARAKERLEHVQPLGRMGKPEDVAYAVLYLASDESSFVTGAELVIDGGVTAH